MSKRKLFIIEDDPLFAEMLMDYLKSKPQWEVSYYPTGELSIKDAYKDPEAVILDYHLDNLQKDGMNGIQTMHELKKIAPGSKCIFLSAQHRYGVALQTISQGADNYIIKDEKAFDEIGRILDEMPVG